MVMVITCGMAMMMMTIMIMSGIVGGCDVIPVDVNVIVVVDVAVVVGVVRVIHGVSMHTALFTAI